VVGLGEVVPTKYITLIKNMYKDAATFVRTCDSNTTDFPINISKGVQGYKGPCLQVIEGVKQLQAKSPKYFKYKFISPPLPSEVVPKYQLCAIGLTFELTWQGNAVSRA